MSSAKTLIVRIQSKDGTKRIEITPNTTVSDLIKKIQEAFKLEPNGWEVYRDREHHEILLKTNKSTISGCKIANGDMLFLDHGPSSLVYNGHIVERTTPTSADTVQLDEVDRFLSAQDGKIQRPKNEKQCQHGSNSKCVHCVPVDPWDEEYLAKQEIRHMSFHAFIRSISTMHGRSSHMHPLENISCKIKPGCTEHAPWPAGICSRCQPSALTLNRQRFRHVDNISFENQYLVNRFLDYWRNTGSQRLGFLIGRYEPHADVPLGIRAVVSAIYEPPQHCTVNGIELQPDPHSVFVEGLAQALGLKFVGWVFTDLVGEGGGQVRFLRNIDTYFLSAEECITGAHFQNLYPNPCKYAAEGFFGSKFATVVVTGDKDKQIHFEGYQMSNQCAALVRDHCLMPTNVPSLAYVKESSNEQYVPEVMYKEKDEYGNDVSRPGRPLPVEYLIVDVPAGMPKEPEFTFYAKDRMQPFPVENRMEIALQNISTLHSYRSQFAENQFPEMINDFHVLLFLLVNEVDPINLQELWPLCDALKNKNRVEVMKWSEANATWNNLVHIMNAQESMGAANTSRPSAPRSITPDGPPGDEGEDAPAGWHCEHCTFTNALGRGDCEMCGLPRQ